MFAGQQLISVAPDDESGRGDSCGVAGGCRVAEPVKGFAPDVSGYAGSVTDAILQVPLRHGMEAREPG